ncbi:MAG: short-chain fatty acyl-CoA regulator family protein [Pseudomonadota bacterium]
MPLTALTGSRLRERRLALQLRQADVANAAGMSASYLNLIEHDRRRAAGDVLVRLAGVLEMDLDDFAEGREAALVVDLRAAASGAVVPVETDRLQDFVGRYPGWAALCAGLQGRVGRLERVVATLNDRLSHDPHLSAAVHDLLSAISAVRSTAAILAEDGDLDPDWRDRFHQNIHQDAERMSRGAEALVAYLAGSGAEVEGASSPQEEVEAWLSGRSWHLAEVEPGGPGAGAVADEVAALPSLAARELAAAWITQAARDAALVPRERLEAALVAGQDDPLRLAGDFGADVLAVFRRIATLPGRPEGLVLCDASGTITFRKPVPAFTPPRFGAACPLWPLYTALARPGLPVEALAEMDGRATLRLRLRAYAETRHVGGFHGVELRHAAMLVTPLPQAATPATVLPIGTTCRVCARAACAARREPSILGA